MNIFDNPVAELLRLIDAAGNQGICLRGMGGIAFEILCNTPLYPCLSRTYTDFDLVTRKIDSNRLEGFFRENGYFPDKEFNTLNGQMRQIYFDPQRDRHIDIFIELFDMCHKIPFTGRLKYFPYTLSPADLFLTKAQIVQLNQKDINDLIRLLITYAPGINNENWIDLEVITQLTSKDWGLFTTISQSLDKTELFGLEVVRDTLSTVDTQILLSNINKIKASMLIAPKTQGWKIRAKIGMRLKWYQDVEEIDL